MSFNVTRTFDQSYMSPAYLIREKTSRHYYMRGLGILFGTIHKDFIEFENMASVYNDYQTAQSLCTRLKRVRGLQLEVITVEYIVIPEDHATNGRTKI